MSVLRDEKMTQTHYIVGVDEVGKGPLAGPVAVAAVRMPRDFDCSVFPHLTDSKKLTPKRREVIFEQALKVQRAEGIRFSVRYQSPQVIDEVGIEEAIRRALSGALDDVKAQKHQFVHILLDGRLKAPTAFSQETIVGGDESVPAISLASVIAKVARDRLMGEYDTQYPVYGFAQHKGYGTPAHIAAIKKHGPSPIHRMSFLSRIAPGEEPGV